MVVFHSVFPYGRKLIEVTVLCSKEAFSRKRRMLFLNFTIKFGQFSSVDGRVPLLKLSYLGKFRMV